MKLTGHQVNQLHAALLAAFDEDGSRRMLAFELDTDLDAVVKQGPLERRVFDLVAWAERGANGKLIIYASQQTPVIPGFQADNGRPL